MVECFTRDWQQYCVEKTFFVINGTIFRRRSKRDGASRYGFNSLTLAADIRYV